MLKGASDSRVRAALIACMAVALLVRALAWWLTWATPPAGDEFDYFARAARLAMGGGLVDPGGRAPGAVFLYTGVFEIFRPWAQLARGANVVIGALAVWPAHALGRRLGGARVGLATAVIVALYPTFIAFSHYLWSETLFIALAGLGLWWTLVADERRSLGWALAAGLVWGAATLTREAGLLVAPACALWLVWVGWRMDPARDEELEARDAEEGLERSSPASGPPARWRSAAALRGAGLLLGFAMTLAPWTIFINEPDLPFTLVTRTSYMNLQAGNSHRATGLELERYTERGRDRAERERASAELAFAYIRERGLAWPFEKIMREAPRFFAPDTFGARRARTPAGDPGNWGYHFRFEFLDRAGFRRSLVFSSVSAYVLVAFAGVAGLCLNRHHRVSLLMGLFVVSQLAPAMITFSMTRFRLPSMLVFAAGAAGLWFYGREDLRAASPARRAVTALALGALAVCVVAGASLQQGGAGS